MSVLVPGVNDLVTKRPDLLSEWDYEKNGDLRPEMVAVGSNKKVWWKCLCCGHEWQASVHNRSRSDKSRKRGTGCPYCAGKRVLKNTNDFESVFPNIASEWHPYRNNELLPNMVTKSSGQEVWWKCSHCGHEWEATVRSRTQGAGCPVCSDAKRLKAYALTVVNTRGSLMDANPDFVAEWDYEKNDGLTPNDVTAKSNKRVWWTCKYGHSWQTSIRHRYETGCPVCNKEKQTSFPEQALFYYLNLVGVNVVSRDVSFGRELDLYLPDLHIGLEYDGGYFHKDCEKDMDKVRWFAERGIHVIRVREDSCPPFDGDAIIRYGQTSESLNVVIRNVFEQLNLEVPSVDVVLDSGQILSLFITLAKENSVAMKYPELVADWHPTRNGNVTPDMLAQNSNRRVWWQCHVCGHEWCVSIGNRTANHRGCPKCASSLRSKGRSVSVVCVETGIVYKNMATACTQLGTRSSHISSCCRHVRNTAAGFHWVYYDDYVKNSQDYVDKVNSELAEKVNNGSLEKPVGRRCFPGRNDFETVCPDIAKEWHPTKNGDLLPNMVAAHSLTVVWWMKPYDDPRTGRHFDFEWQASVYSRAKGTGCPYLSNPCKAVMPGFNDLMSVRDDLAKAWSYEKNVDIDPTTVSFGSGKKFWWVCANCGKTWQAVIANMTRRDRVLCPDCAKAARVDPNALSVRCVETGDVYSSATAAARAYELRSYAVILASCRNADKVAGGYHWQFVDKADEV